MGVQATRTAEEARMAEENMAAVRSALADMLAHGGGFAGEPQQESRILTQTIITCSWV